MSHSHRRIFLCRVFPFHELISNKVYCLWLLRMYNLCEHELTFLWVKRYRLREYVWQPVCECHSDTCVTTMSTTCSRHNCLLPLSAVWVSQCYLCHSEHVPSESHSFTCSLTYIYLRHSHKLFTQSRVSFGEQIHSVSVNADNVHNERKHTVRYENGYVFDRRHVLHRLQTVCSMRMCMLQQWPL